MNDELAAIQEALERIELRLRLADAGRQIIAQRLARLERVAGRHEDYLEMIATLAAAGDDLPDRRLN
ncbi:MAG: hypothetical protein DCC66_13425 [Planctomycetota bacterium]|nr:MAG: hypothetical protein DCC66_13425 [Planctomycetota bacterium]